jgi:hypothetical protein
MAKFDKKNIEDILSLTSMQEGMLFHYLKEPKSDHYFEQLSLEISGEIDFASRVSVGKSRKSQPNYFKKASTSTEIL